MLDFETSVPHLVVSQDADVVFTRAQSCSAYFKHGVTCANALFEYCAVALVLDVDVSFLVVRA